MGARNGKDVSDHQFVLLPINTCSLGYLSYCFVQSGFKKNQAVGLLPFPSRDFHSKIYLTVRRFYLTFFLTVTPVALVISPCVTLKTPLSRSGEWAGICTHQSTTCLTKHTFVSHSWAKLCLVLYLHSPTCTPTSPDQLCPSPPKIFQICQYLSGYQEPSVDCTSYFGIWDTRQSYMTGSNKSKAHFLFNTA